MGKTISQVLENAYDDINKLLKVSNGIIPKGFDYVGVTYPSATQEVYAFKTGGSSGVLICTVTINYTDSNKLFISNITRV